MGCNWFSWVDILKLIVPVGWAIMAIAAVIAYAIVGRVVPAFMAAVSGLISIILSIQIFNYHSYMKYVLFDEGKKREHKRDGFWIVQMFISGLFFVFCVVSSILFAVDQNSQGDSPLEAIWTGIGMLVMNDINNCRWVFFIDMDRITII
eukprot:TRINITY_DN6151_c0_g1_i2.p1 TRINITY_DN6151_c0_g1~~TRINITY_DN6151_c0_g1_i2.p1  ORF type:complete len:149 (-),score=20.76 TRINITY_DN6151_c0_g1_i2:172-618(-)